MTDLRGLSASRVGLPRVVDMLSTVHEDVDDLIMSPSSLPVITRDMQRALEGA